jgi:hypothetical protein
MNCRHFCECFDNVILKASEGIGVNDSYSSFFFQESIAYLSHKKRKRRVNFFTPLASFLGILGRKSKI